MKKKLDSLSGTNKPATTPAVEEVKPQENPVAKEAEKPAEMPVEKSEEKAAETKPTEEKPAEAPIQTPSEAPKEAMASAPTEGTPAPDSFESLFPEPRTALGAPPSWLWWVLLLIVSAVLGVVGYALTQKNLKDWLSTSPKASPTVSASPSPTASASPSPTTTPTATPTPSPSGVVPANVTLRVLNGTTVTGAAGKAKTVLEKAGFTVRTTGNASNQNYATTTVYYQTGRQAEADAVKAALTDYTVTEQESSLAAPDMVLVVIGKK